MSVFEWPVRVYWEDTDAGGVVYHTSYIRYFERGRTEWLRQLGYSQSRLAEETGLLFTVVDLNTEFIRPARLDDLLAVRSRVLKLGAATITFDQRIVRSETNEVLVQGKVRVASLAAGSFKPRRLPASLREELK